MIQRKPSYTCHFCNQAIDPQLIKEKSVARATTSWLLIRGGVKRKHMGLKLCKGYAHNVCVEAAFTPGKVIGQEEAWPAV